MFILALCAFGVYRVVSKAALPARLDGVAIRNVTQGARSELQGGDTVIAIGGQRVRSNDELDFLTGEYKIGDSIPVELTRKGSRVSISVALVRDVSIDAIFIECFVALIFFFIAIAVTLLQKQEQTAHVFHHLCIAITALILLTSGRFTILPAGSGYLLELAFQLVYVLVPVLFFHFCLRFPRQSISGKKILIPFYLAAFAITIWADVVFLKAAYPAVNLNFYAEYRTAFDAIRIFFVIIFLGGFGNLIRTYRFTKEEFERRKLRWIFFGIAFGASGYIFLTLLPQLILGRALVNEEYSLLFSIVAPISFAIAIIRYQVFDIDLLFKRSTAYSVALGSLLLAYSGIVALLNHIARLYGLSSSIPDILGALLIALLFEPVRKRVQKFVDKKFFRISYDYHEALRTILEEIKFSQTTQHLAEAVTSQTDEILSVQRIAFFTIRSFEDRMTLVAQKGFDILERRGIKLKKEDLKTGLDLPVALDEKMEPGATFESADPEVFSRWGIALILPLLSGDRNPVGFLVLGEKLSGARFSLEDISLLNTISVQSGLALGRIMTEGELLREQEESERLVELNRLKSYFVSSVSHDLKTPLTSIRMFAEIMNDRDDLPRQKAKEYLGIIEGEADRLSRVITNVLDFAKIEKGTKDYLFKPVDLNVLALEVVRSLEYQLHSQGFTIHTLLSTEVLAVSADRDAVFDALTNLITNAIKYSPAERKNIMLRSATENGFATISVEDEGYGIDQGEIEKIFESFYRIGDPRVKSAGGAGLGLSLVKHTMDAHHGKVEVKSEIGKGSIFVLCFPMNPNEKNSDR